MVFAAHGAPGTVRFKRKRCARVVASGIRWLRSTPGRGDGRLSGRFDHCDERLAQQDDGWLQTTYPKAKFKEVHAAIGGTGNDLGVFRLGRDVLAHRRPAFRGVATNDGNTAPGRFGAAWRHRAPDLEARSQTDIVFTYTITTAFTKLLQRAVQSLRFSDKLLADHCAIPSINSGRAWRLNQREQAIMDAKVIRDSVPKESADRDRLIRERIAAQIAPAFANDGVHPRDEDTISTRPRSLRA